MPVMAPTYVPPGMPPFQHVAMPTSQPMAYPPSSMPGMPATFAPQLTQPNMPQPVMGTFQPITHTGSPAMMRKLAVTVYSYTALLKC